MNNQHPVTYDQASARYGHGTHAARERYEELTGWDIDVRTAAMLRERGQFDPENPAGIAWSQPASR